MTVARLALTTAGALLALAGLAAGAADVVDLKGRVRFRFPAGAGASSVHLAGSFNGWAIDDAWALADGDRDGVFEGTFTLPPGRQQYKFVVDRGRWVADPDASETDDDGHGGKNSVVVVTDAAGGGGATGGGTTTERSPFGSTSQTREPAFIGEVFFVEPGTQRIPDLSKLTPQGRIYAESFDVAPRKFDEGFPGLSDRFEWFVIRYRGKFRVEHGGVHRFRLLSDDASRLFINGRLAVDNDGLHEPREVVQMIKLPEGTYDLTLEYMQGPALDVALQLFVKKPRSTEEEVVRVAAPVPGRE